VANAGWYPNYDVRVTNVNAPIKLKYKADVYQNTGVAWNNVKLRFSNGNPNQSGVAPELSKWYVNFARNTIYSRSTASVLDPIRTVKGRVLESDTGEPLPGVNVIVKGSTVGTTTDFDGNYQLNLPNNASNLVYSFVGMVSKDIPVTSPKMNVALGADVRELQEVVVTGYGQEGQLMGRAAGVSIRGYSTIRNRRSKSAKIVTTTTVENQTTVEFEVETPYTIKSNAERLTIDLNQFEIPTLYEYYAVPKLDKDAFLIAKIINWDQYNLLEGEANLFFEDSFVGRSVLDANTLTDTLDISLGRDRGIVIRRTKIDDYSKRRTMGGNKIDSRGFEILVRNNKSESIHLTLFDQIPVPAINDISVTPRELSNGKFDEEEGEITWELDLAPGDQVDLNLAYDVKYPKREKVHLE